MSEHDEQCAVIEFCDWVAATGRHPELSRLFAVPNGAKLPYRRDSKGQRYSKEAIHLKREGLRPGVPDLCLPVPMGGYHGLFLEMKYGKNTTTPEQNDWIECLRGYGYRVEVCSGASQAIRVLCEYLRIGATEYANYNGGE